jgi:hypothetical protein
MSYLYCFCFLEYCNFLFFFLSTAISCIFWNTAGFWSTSVSCIFFCFLGGGGEESRDLHTVLLIIYCLFVSFFLKKNYLLFNRDLGTVLLIIFCNFLFIMCAAISKIFFFFYKKSRALQSVRNFFFWPCRPTPPPPPLNPKPILFFPRLPPAFLYVMCVATSMTRHMRRRRIHV